MPEAIGFISLFSSYWRRLQVAGTHSIAGKSVDFTRSSWTQQQDPVAATPQRLAPDCCFFRGLFFFWSALKSNTWLCFGSFAVNLFVFTFEPDACVKLSTEGNDMSAAKLNAGIVARTELDCNVNVCAAVALKETGRTATAVWSLLLFPR